MRDCIKRVVEKSNSTLSQDAARELLKSIEQEAQRKTSAGIDYDDALAQVIAERKKNTTSNLQKARLNTMRNISIKAGVTDKISRMVDSGLDIKSAFIAELEGINSPLSKTRSSLDVNIRALESTYYSKLIGKLNTENLLQVFNSKKFSDDIGRELWAVSEGKSIAKNKQVKRIAEILHETLEGQRLRLNMAGAEIDKTPGFIMPQRHDVHAMWKAGADDWANFMLPLLDEERSFGGDYTDLFDVLRGAHEAMVTGIRLNDPLEQSEKLFQFKGYANLGKRLSQARQLHFKDFDSWKKWNETYGMKDLNEGIIDAVRFNAGNIGLMERYGTNPEAMLRAVADDIKRKHRGGAAEKGQRDISPAIDGYITNAMHKNNIPANPSLAKIGAMTRTFNNVTMLGGAVISSLTDIPIKSLEYKYQGKSWLGSFAQPFIDLAQGFKSKKERIEFASMLGVGMESMIGDIGGRFSLHDDLGDKAIKVQRMFFKLNGLSWWTDTHQLAMGRVMSHDLALKKNLSFDKLDADTKRLFGNYDIAEKEWDVMRESATKLEDGREYITPDSINNSRVSEKLAGYFIDRVQTGVITPSVKEQRLLSLGTRKGTPAGEAIRMIMQFKSFPLAMVTKVWGRALYGKGKADVPAILYLMLMSAGFGYMAMTAKDLLKGKTPRDPNKPETIFAALAQGGGAGIIGDILYQDYGFGRSLTSATLGPTASRLDEIAKIYSETVRGKGAGKAQMLRTATSYIPFNNLFYARAALDQTLLLQIMNDLNPGYLQRMENNMRKTYGQELLFK